MPHVQKVLENSKFESVIKLSVIIGNFKGKWSWNKLYHSFYKYKVEVLVISLYGIRIFMCGYLHKV